MSLSKRPAGCNARVHLLIRFEQPLLAGLPEDPNNLEGMFRFRLKDKRKRSDDEYAAMVAGVRAKMGNPPLEPESKYRRRLKMTGTGTYFWGAGQWIEVISDAMFYIHGVYRNVTGRRLYLDPGMPGLFWHTTGRGFVPANRTSWHEHTVPPDPIKRRPSIVACSQMIEPCYGGLYSHYDLWFDQEFFGLVEVLANAVEAAGWIGTGTLRTSGMFGRFEVLQIWERTTADVDPLAEHAYQGCSCHEFLLAQQASVTITS